MKFMIPVWLASDKPQIAASDLAALKGTTIAMVDDNYDVPFTTHLEHLLREVHGAIVERIVKPLGSAPSPRSLLEQAAKSRVAVVGIGL